MYKVKPFVNVAWSVERCVVHRQMVWLVDVWNFIPREINVVLKVFKTLIRTYIEDCCLAWDSVLRHVWQYEVFTDA